MIKRFVSAVLFIGLQSNGDSGLAAVWDYGCQGAINYLRNEQQEVESAHHDFESAQSNMESAKFSYSLCSPSRYADCEFERSNANYAIQQYNYALDSLKSQLRDFDYAVTKFKRECVQ